METCPQKAQLAAWAAGNHDACTTAAERIKEADVLLLLTGAGFSADSGLAVYVDVANVPAYIDRGLDYADLCDPRWLEEEPSLYWGFWGSCFNDYRETDPHEGYELIAQWCEKYFADTVVAEALRTAQHKEKTEPDAREAYSVEGPAAGAFFSFTCAASAG